MFTTVRGWGWGYGDGDGDADRCCGNGDRYCGDGVEMGTNTAGMVGDGDKLLSHAALYTASYLAVSVAVEQRSNH